MRSKFPGYFKLPEQTVTGLWKNGLVVLDANVLLNFYRYSDDTRSEFVRLLSAFKTRLWIPHRAAQEFLSNRLEVIGQQEKSYDEAIKTLAGIEDRLKDARQHPFIPQAMLKRLGGIFSEVSKHLSQQKEAHSNRLSSDPILAEIETVVSGRIGEPFSEEEVAKLCKEGGERFKRKLPPGYKDASKDDEVGDERRFGDLILWKQIIHKAKGSKCGVVFVTDDRKEDWWHIFKGNTFGPRPELVKEFLAESGQNILMYQPYRFLEASTQYLGERVKPEAIDETRERQTIEQDTSQSPPLEDRQAAIRRHWIERRKEQQLEMAMRLRYLDELDGRISR